MVYREVLKSILKSLLKLPRIIQNGFSAFKSEEESSVFPLRIQVENSTICNLKCQMCPLFEMKREKGMMKFDQFKAIYDKIKPLFLNLTGYGESFLNPDILKMVNYAKKNGSYVKFDNNGTIVDKHKTIETIESGLDLLSFSVDAVDEKTYEKIRGKNLFEKLIKNLIFFVDERNKRGSDLEIHAAIVVQEDNLSELTRLIKLLDQIGVDKINPTPVIEYDIPENRKFKLNKYIESLKKTLGEIDRLKPYIKAKLDLGPLREFAFKKNEIDAKKRSCFIPWYSTYIAFNGDVFPCCYYYDGQIKFGNIFEKDFSEIWNSLAYKKFRMSVLKNRNKLPICSSCELDEKFITDKVNLIKKIPFLKRMTKR